MKINPLGTITDAEKGLVKAALEELKANIEKVRFFSPLPCGAKT